MGDMQPLSEPLSCLPVPTSTIPYWQGNPLPLDDYQSLPNVPGEVDVAIIGASMAGTCSAYHILKNNPRCPSVAIVEARQACSGATGRNDGHTKGFPIALAKVHATRGAEAAAEFAAFVKTLMYEMKACAYRRLR
jgi:cation diffusion facilitator CzcD-associated flavoprotein CzcO